MALRAVDHAKLRPGFSLDRGRILPWQKQIGLDLERIFRVPMRQTPTLDRARRQPPGSGGASPYLHHQLTTDNYPLLFGQEVIFLPFADRVAEPLEDLKHILPDLPLQG